MRDRGSEIDGCRYSLLESCGPGGEGRRRGDRQTDRDSDTDRQSGCRAQPRRNILEDRPEKRGSDLAQAGFSEGTLNAPVYHALKGGQAGPFEVADRPAGSLETCRC